MNTKTLKFAFQPIVDAKTGDVFGYEALMRPGDDSPEEIISAYAERDQLGVVEEATFFYGMRAFLDAGLEGFLFLNSFPSENLPMSTAKKIGDLGGRELKGRLFIEILEYTNINTMAWNMKRRALISTGASPRFAIDDFGSGKNVDVQCINLYKPELIKIDRKYISGIDSNEKNQSVVRDMIRTFHNRGIKALAEGVETEAEYNFLKTTEVDLMQGFYIGEPKIYE